MGRKLLAILVPAALAALLHTSIRSDDPLPPDAQAHRAPATAEAQTDAELLVWALEDAEASGAEPLAVRRQLQGVLLRRPELADAAARAFGRLTSGPILFQVGRTLGGYIDRPAVRAVLLEAVADPAAPETRREAAAYGLNGLRDAEAAERLAAAFLDEAAPQSVRTAAAFSLMPALGSLDAARLGAVRARSRELLAQGDAPPELRAEAVDLVDPAADRSRLEGLLDGEEDPELVLAAARRLLSSGADPGPVLSRLEELANRSDVAPTLATSLKAVLDEVPADVTRSEGMTP